MTTEVSRRGVGRGGVRRVAAGVVDPQVRDAALGRGEGGGNVAQAGPRGLPGRHVVRVVTGGGNVDLAVVRGPGSGLHVVRLDGRAVAVELGRGPRSYRGRRAGQVQLEDLLPGQAADRGEVAFYEVEGPAVAELLVVDPGPVRGHPGELIVTRNRQVQEAVVLAGRDVQAGEVGVGRASVDRGVVPAGQHMAAVGQQGLDLAGGAVRECGVHRAGGGGHLGDVLDRGAVDRGELAAPR